MSKNKVLVIGAGLAGCEASYLLAQNGISVVLIENKKLQRNHINETRRHWKLESVIILSYMGKSLITLSN